MKLQVLSAALRYCTNGCPKFSGQRKSTAFHAPGPGKERQSNARIGRAKLTQSEVESMLRHTPKLSKGSDRLFRKLHDKGEYCNL
ncbi:hypothetical protein PoB_003573800 [Plakobranchus ocellatus]|uniref:Uncharacterized protein n=1 Tax=Plakobranchus ocellatus TaxID=259542 RepID=A0AAV4APE1_9GAST|nr:hypothetical protein PoB_003573800 [Plakobranchus ocellatus]